MIVFRNHGLRILVVIVAVVGSFVATSIPAEEAAEGGPPLPTLKFFYYDSGRIEWVVSAEPDRLERHLQANPDSARLFGSLTQSVDEAIDTEEVRLQMARWLADEREQSGGGGNVVRLRKAEGIVAYLRAHDFRIDQLVQQLLKRSGASDVEIAAVHLVDGAGNSSFHLKVVLPDEQVGLGQQGFNVASRSPDVTYTSVVYALALALYEVHEIINADSASEGTGPSDIEALPPPDLDLPAVDRRLLSSPAAGEGIQSATGN